MLAPLSPTAESFALDSTNAIALNKPSCDKDRPLGRFIDIVSLSALLEDEDSAQDTDSKPDDIANVLSAKVFDIVLEHKQQFRVVLGFVKNTVYYGALSFTTPSSGSLINHSTKCLFSSNKQKRACDIE